jgi:hypothetical protein
LDKQENWQDRLHSLHDLDVKSLGVVESANRLGENEDRDEAVAIANNFREAYAGLETAAGTYSRLYEMRRRVLREIVASGGSLRATSLLRVAPEHTRMLSDADEIWRSQRAIVRGIEERYAAFKGTTGLSE